MDLDQKKWANKALEISNTILDVRTPEEFSEGYISNAVNFLISPAGSYITGTVINVSGGLVI